MLANYGFVPQSTVAIALTGMLVGAASQGVAYVMVRGDDTVRNMMASHFGLFCLLWITWIVGLNLLIGWNLTGTRCGRPLCGTENTMDPRQQRTMLQMESMYFAGSILGIWSTWIGIDVFDGDAEHAVSSVVLLCFSIVSFATILHCFPEDSCVEDPASEFEQGNYAPPPLLLAVQTV
jgi:hypothetical protein